MRELNVYYCPKCGHYGYHLVPKNAVCPICQEIMLPLPMSYQSFMNLEFDMRDTIIANQIAGDVIPDSSVVQRITALEKDCTSRFVVAELKAYIIDLENKNQDLASQIKKLLAENEALAAEATALLQKKIEQAQTIDWMHDMIWDLTNKLHNPN